MTKILAIILSLTSLFSWFNPSVIRDAFDSAFSLVTGIPFSQESVNDAFIEDIDGEDVSMRSSNIGYYKNMLVLMIDEKANVIDRYKIIKNNNLILLGWFCLADVYFVSCCESTLEGLTSLGEKLTNDNELILGAFPFIFNKNTPDKTPNDPFCGDSWSESFPYGENWYLEMIQYREATNYSRYFNNIKVGVCDTGFELDHPELKDKISFPSAKEKNRNLPDSHGTHVAGIIGANCNNEVGIAGICDKCEMVCSDWEPDFDQSWNESIAIFMGFLRLVKSGAKVINFSVGTASSYLKDDINFADKMGIRLSAALFSATFSVLLSKGYDFIVVQSAGNGDGYCVPLDAIYNGNFASITKDTALSVKPGVSKNDILDRIIVAGAIGRPNLRSVTYMTDWSNYGERVDIVAPGSYVYSLDLLSEDGYYYMSGTSASAPIVSGVVALTWSVNPDLKGSEVKKIITSSTKQTAKFEDTDSADDREYPIVNALLSVEKALQTKYKMARVSGHLDYDDAVFYSDIIELTSGGITENISVVNRDLCLLIEPGDAIIKYIGPNTPFEDLHFKVEDDSLKLDFYYEDPAEDDDDYPETITDYIFE